MKHNSHTPPPSALLKRGIRSGHEVAPVECDFVIRDAGKTLAGLFGPEILRRLAILKSKPLPKESV